MRSGRPPTLWWLLMVTEGPPGEADALDHVGIERALGQEFGAADLLRFRLEDVDEEPADGLALGLRIGPLLELADEKVAGVYMHERDVIVPRNRLTTCSASAWRIKPWSTKTQVSWSPIAS